MTMVGGEGSTRIVEDRRGPHKGEAYGVASVTNLLKGIDFPISRDEILRKFGNQEVHWTKQKSFKLKDCMQDAPEEFQSVTQITQAVSASVKRR
jgi:hypothetical protein